MTGSLTTASLVALALAAAAAVVDWWAVAKERKDVEYVAKPAVLVALIAAAAALVPADGAVRTAMVIGLTLGLIGDVLLMLDRFVPGAAAFLLGHVAYVVAFLMVPLFITALVVGAILLALLLFICAGPILRGAGERAPSMRAIVSVYLVALGAVLVLGSGTAVAATAAGVALFAVSDALLAYGRFVGPAPGGRVLVHITYHLGQALLVISLLRLA
jgi:uncharacterized membrane protein YhhN